MNPSRWFALLAVLVLTTVGCDRERPVRYPPKATEFIAIRLESIGYWGGSRHIEIARSGEAHFNNNGQLHAGRVDADGIDELASLATRDAFHALSDDYSDQWAGACDLDSHQLAVLYKCSHKQVATYGAGGPAALHAVINKTVELASRLPPEEPR